MNKPIAPLLRQILEKPEHWTKGTLFRNQLDIAVLSSMNACKFCLYGAYIKATIHNPVTPNQDVLLTTELHQAIRTVTGKVSQAIGAFNDEESTTFETIQKVIDEFEKIENERLALQEIQVDSGNISKD
jgi:hypothetical protein